MGRIFNTEGICFPKWHYMVCLDGRVRQIKEQYVDRGSYFIINRARQYGKTTTLMALAEYLKEWYSVISMDFQEMSSGSFRDEPTFVVAFIEYLEAIFEDEAGLRESVGADAYQNLLSLKEERLPSMDKLFRHISKLCKAAQKPMVLLVDEVDSASNNQVFIDFLAQLRGYYLKRAYKATFQSVILAGVYDIKNLKLKIRPEAEHQYNSPWNIAADFDVSMSFSPGQVAGMLREYEGDHHTGMEVGDVSECICEYTSGYPYLVSALCKRLDEKVAGKGRFAGQGAAWTRDGVAEAVNLLLGESTPLFDSMAKQLDIYKDLRNVIEDILYRGQKIPYSPDVKSINIGMMFGFLKEENGQVFISNRFFEMRMLNMFIAEEAIYSNAFRYGERDSCQFTEGGRLDMELVLRKFVEHFHDIYGDNDEQFIEEYGRKFFLLYLKPIINGVGNYYLEARTRDARRTDVIVDYLGEQFIVELKIWHGNEYQERGEGQLAGYLDAYHQDKGYMLSFNFNKKKEVGVKEIQVGSKTILEAVV